MQAYKMLMDDGLFFLGVYDTGPQSKKWFGRRFVLFEEIYIYLPRGDENAGKRLSLIGKNLWLAVDHIVAFISLSQDALDNEMKMARGTCNDSGSAM